MVISLLVLHTQKKPEMTFNVVRKISQSAGRIFGEVDSPKEDRKARSSKVLCTHLTDNKVWQHLSNLFEWKRELRSCLSFNGRELRTTGVCINVSTLF